jgi:murein DD-endopeptidase MepM/ murein hydrolase activator NlpD
MYGQAEFERGSEKRLSRCGLREPDGIGTSSSSWRKVVRVYELEHQIGRSQQEMKGRWIAAAMAAALLATVVSVPGVQAESSTRQKVKEIRNQKKSVLDQIAALNPKMEKLKQEMMELEGEIADLKEKNGPLIDKYLAQKKEAEKYRQRLKKQLANMYVQGDTNYLARLLQAESFDEFLQRFEVLRILTQQDHETWANYHKEIEKMEKAYGKVFENLKQQEALVQEYNEKMGELIAERKKYEANLENIDEQLEMYEDEVIRINLEEWRAGKLRFGYTGPFRHPTNTQITSGFKNRYHPVYHKYIWHKGVDFAGPLGVPVYSAADGVVVGSEPAGGYGWLVTIYHGDRNGVPVFTRYAHMYRKDVLVRIGEEVKKGQQIGRVGNNGVSTGPHLHFEVRLGESLQAVNPVNYFE